MKFRFGLDKIVLLLAEDDPVDVQFFKTALAESEILEDLQIARDGKEVLNYFEGVRKGVNVMPSLVLLDINLPRYTGLEVLEKLKKDEDFCIVPIIIYSSTTNEADLMKAYKLGANCFVRKQADPALIKSTLLKIEDFWSSVAVLPCKTL